MINHIHRLDAGPSICKDIMAKKRLQSKKAAKASDINKENDPKNSQCIMSCQRVLRKRPQKQVSMKEESTTDDSESEMLDNMNQNEKPKNKLRISSQNLKRKSNQSLKRQTVQSETDSDSNEVTNSDTKSKKLPATKSVEVNPDVKLSESGLVNLNEESSASDSEDDLLDVITNEMSVDVPKAETNKDCSHHHIPLGDTAQESSNSGDVMEMLMACESSNTKDQKNAQNDSDVGEVWEQVEASEQPSPKKKTTKPRTRKRKLTENSDPDFEASSKEKAKKLNVQNEEKSRKRKKNTVKTDSEQEESKPKKAKKKELTDTEKEIKRFTNRCLKDRDSCFEQCSLIFGVAFLRNVTQCSSKSLFQSLLLSQVPVEFHVAEEGFDQYITSLLDWYRVSFHLKQNEEFQHVEDTCSIKLMQLLTSSETPHEHIYVAGFYMLLLVLGIETRFVGSLYVPSLEKVAKPTKHARKVNNPNPLYWVEAKDKDKILAIDVFNGFWTEDAFVEDKFVLPQGYIVSITPNLAVLDSTPKYIEKWSEIHRKARMLNHEFWDSFIADQPKHWLTLQEHSKIMKKIMVARGFPKSLGGFKHNLVFALEKDNLKIEALYPKDAPILGTFKNHNVYSRDNVMALKQIIVIKKEGRALKEGEIPYKIVKQKIIYDRWPGDDRWKDLPLYGDWQTEWYKAPTAENGVVPRNEFGNVELFKPWMLPKNSVHVDLPGSYALARRLKIDAAHAVTGFEFPRCRAVPVMSGVVVCQEHAETLKNAWVEYNAIQIQRAEVRD